MTHAQLVASLFPIVGSKDGIPQMKFGLFHSVQLPNSNAQQRYYREALDQVLRAEQLGFDSVWFTEHHFTRHGIVSATLPVLAYLAGVTSTIRLGTAVTVLPFHNPIQLAEDAATVDLLSDGRLDFGVGRGYQWGEYNRLNIPMDEADRRFEESMEVITQAWTAEEPFDHRGEFWTFNDMTVLPRPVQLPTPPVWVAASSENSMNRVATHNWNLLVSQGETFQGVAHQMEYFRRALGEASFEYRPNRITVARAMHTAPTAAQARADSEVPFAWFRQTGNEVSAPPDRRADLLPDNFERYRQRFAANPTFDYEAAVENVILFGTPELVSQKIDGLHQSGVENLILFINYGGIDTQKVIASMELFATEVMPQFRD